jgi:hypothetical protein
MKGGEMIKKKRPILYLLMIGVLLSILLIPSVASAEVTAWKNPSSEFDDDFNNPTNAYTNDNNYATAIVSSGGSENHQYYDYNLGILAGTIIEGIEVRLDYSVTGDTGEAVNASVELSWNGGSSWTTAQTDSSEPLDKTTIIFGGPTDTWDHTWSADELSNANFRVRVTFSTDI